jgi:hypothetical protein
MDQYLNSTAKNNMLNILAIGGGIYVLKSIYDTISGYFKESNEIKQIKSIIEKDKSLNNSEMSRLSKNEICYLLYLNILHTVYRKHISSFNKRRLALFKSDDMKSYIACIEDYLEKSKLIEQNILQIIFEELKIEKEGSDFTYEKINISELKRKHYNDTSIDLPKNVDKNKIREVVIVLFDKTKIYLAELRKHYHKKDNHDKLQLIAEYMAFDYIYQEHDIDRDVIEKAMSFYDLTIIEK